MKVGLIGAGKWGENHLRNLLKMHRYRSIYSLYVCDSNQKVISKLPPNINYCSDYKYLSGIVDCVVIATPSSTHYEIGKYFLENNTHVLIEKPMALTVDECEELISIAKSKKLVLMVGHLFRYHPAVNYIKTQIAKGKFGDIYYIVSNRLAFGEPRKDMGVLHALSVHDIDIFYWLLNKDIDIKSIQSSISDFNLSKFEVFVQLIFKINQTLCLSQDTWISPIGGKQRFLYVVGSLKSAFIDYLEPNKVHISNTKILKGNFDFKETKVVNVSNIEPLKEELYDFIKCCSTGESPVADSTSGLNTIKVVSKILRYKNV